MRASVLFEQGKPLSVEDLELEPPRTGEVLVRMAASGVCHSCLHAADGSWKGVPVPIVLGDEGAGVVEAVGPGVDGLGRGDHVILSWAPTCGRCHYCVIGRPNLCERRQPGRGVLPDGTTRMSLRGRAVYHYGHVATYASSTVVHESCAIKIDEAVPLDRAALIGCSVMTGVGAVINTAKVWPGANVAVFGLGGIGLNVIQGARMVGADKIVGIDTNPGKRGMAEKFGMTHFINPDEAGRDKVVQAIVDLTGGGADFSFECIGNVATMRQALECCHRGWGESIIIGVAGAGQEISTRPFQLVTGRVWRGTAFGGARGRTDVPKIVDWYMDGKINIDDLITHTMPLEAINDAFELMHEGKSIRSVVIY